MAMTRPITLRWQEEIVPAGGVQLHVRRVVTPPAPPLLLLHGLGVTGSVWVPFARRLAPRYAAVAPDLRGHGASDEPPKATRPSITLAIWPPLATRSTSRPRPCWATR